MRASKPDSGPHRGGWSPSPGALLCGVVGYGTPIHVHLIGETTLSDAGPVLLIVGLFTATAVWMFRRWGAGTGDRRVAADSEALWAELERVEAESVEVEARTHG